MSRRDLLIINQPKNSSKKYQHGNNQKHFYLLLLQNFKLFFERLLLVGDAPNY